MFFDWPFLLVEEFIQTVAEHTTGTGTLNATNGSTSISATASAWTAAMTGRKIRIASDNEWYTFTQASATTGTLDRAYEGSTTTTGSYVIYQDTYKTHGDVNKVKLFRNLGQQITLVHGSPSEFDRAMPASTTNDTPLDRDWET